MVIMMVIMIPMMVPMILWKRNIDDRTNKNCSDENDKNCIFESDDGNEEKRKDSQKSNHGSWHHGEWFPDQDRYNPTLQTVKCKIFDDTGQIHDVIWWAHLGNGSKLPQTRAEPVFGPPFPILDNIVVQLGETTNGTSSRKTSCRGEKNFANNHLSV